MQWILSKEWKLAEKAIFRRVVNFCLLFIALKKWFSWRGQFWGCLLKCVKWFGKWGRAQMERKGEKKRGRTRSTDPHNLFVALKMWLQIISNKSNKGWQNQLIHIICWPQTATVGNRRWQQPGADNEDKMEEKSTGSQFFSFRHWQQNSTRILFVRIYFSPYFQF